MLGALTVPLLKAESIEAAVRQAEANLRATESMRRQAGNDLAARVVADLLAVRDMERELALLEETVLPRVARLVALARSSYEAGRSPLFDLLDAERSRIAIERLVADLRAARAKRLAGLEAAVGSRLTTATSNGASH